MTARRAPASGFGRCRALALGLCLGVLAHWAAAQTIALTFDDGFDPRADTRVAQWNESLLAALKAANVRTMLFPAGKVVDTPAGLALVAQWSRAGHAIGNHSYAHRSLGAASVTAEAFTADVLVAARLFDTLPGWQPMLRFPYLKEGGTADKRDAVRRWMREHGYRAAPVSIDTSDWYYNARYLELEAAGRLDLLVPFRTAYLIHLLDRVREYDKLAKAVLGRSPAHVMLLHANAINAALIGDVIQALRAEGWRVVSPLTAFADPLYALQPDTLPAGESIVWSLARKAGVADLRYPAEDGAYEEKFLRDTGLLLPKTKDAR